MKSLKNFINISLMFLFNILFLASSYILVPALQANFSSKAVFLKNAEYSYFENNKEKKNNSSNSEKNAILPQNDKNLSKNHTKNDNLYGKSIFNKTEVPSGNHSKMAIVIDDFGSFDQSGVNTLLKLNEKLTCAVIPNVDNTNANISEITKYGHELILHMPMQAHVNLPESWYGPIYIKTYDTPETVYEKLNRCVKNFPEIKGFNIHIGSGVSKNKELMKVIYNYAKEHNLYFLDSRTIITNATEEACKETNSIYLGRDVFLEADKNKSYAGVCYRLMEGANIAKQKGYSIVIGHVGAEGGENTAKAILDSVSKIKEMGVEIVPLSEIYEMLKDK